MVVVQHQVPDHIDNVPILDRYKQQYKGSVEDLIREQMLLTYDEQRSRHERLLSEILAMSQGSKMYEGRFDIETSLDDLSSVPITPYEMIHDVLTKHGADDVLMAKALKCYHTSGSTGTEKKIYMGEEDLERLAQTIVMVTHLMGVGPNHVSWNLGATEPLVCGDMISIAASRIPIKRYIPTLLADDTDLLKALKRISKEDRVDAMASAALIYYLIARIVLEPHYLDGLVKDQLIRRFKVPKFLAGPIASIYLSGLDRDGLARVAQTARVGISYAEPVDHYIDPIKKAFPNIHMYDTFGSTENPVVAFHLFPEAPGLSLMLEAQIPEIADPKEVAEAKLDPTRRVIGVPWYDWHKGMTGELIITRPGQCLPLIRYPTGDVIEVIDPSFAGTIDLDGQEERLVLPLVRVLGRAVDMIDFEVKDESGNFLGNKIYSRYITDALAKSGNVKWWELYNIKGKPGRLAFVIVPEKEVEDVNAYREVILHHLLKECDDYHQTIRVGHDLGLLEIIIAKPEAHAIIQAEIDRRMKAGRPIGQLKPKHIFVVEGEEEFRQAMAEKNIG